MAHHRPVRLVSVTALLCVLPGLVTACGGGSEPDAGDGPAPTPASATPPEPESAAATQAGSGGSADSAMSTLSSGVSAEAAACYSQALGELRPAFDRFTVDYAAAMEKMDGHAVRAAATVLRRAVADFDAVVRGLDLTAVQRHVDTLLALNSDVLATLDAVGTATSGAQAVRIMEMLPYQDFIAAYDAVADAL
jgi:hypothetical protein